MGRGMTVMGDISFWLYPILNEGLYAKYPKVDKFKKALYAQ